MAAEPSISVTTILATYTTAEINEEISRLKLELRNAYRSTGGSSGKHGERDTELVRADLEAFGQAKRILSGGAGIIQTQAVAVPVWLPRPCNVNFDTGSGC